MYCLVIIFITFYISPCARGDDGLSYLRNEIFRKDKECADLVVYSQFQGVDAERAEKQAEDRHNDCIFSLNYMVDNYVERKSKVEGKSVEEWIGDPKNSDVYFSSSADRYVVKVTKDYGKNVATTYVYLPLKYNKVSRVTLDSGKDDGLGFLRNQMFEKDAKCRSLYESSQFEDRYNECMADLERLAELYVKRKSTQEDKSVEEWLKNPQTDEIYFSMSSYCYVLKVTHEESKKSTYVYLPSKYNPNMGYDWGSQDSKPTKDYATSEPKKNYYTPVAQKGTDDASRKGLKAKLKSLLSRFRAMFSWLLPRRNRKGSDSPSKNT